MARNEIRNRESWKPQEQGKAAAEVRTAMRSDEQHILRFDAGVPFSRLCKWMSAQDHLVLVGESGGPPCGYVAGRLEGDDIVVERLFVEESRRRAGVARALLDRLASKLSGRGSLLCDVDDTELDAHRFLSRVGFRAVGTTRHSADPWVYHFQRGV